MSEAKLKLIKERALRARTDFREFCKFVLGFPPAAHQEEWVEELQAIADNPEGKRLCIIAPPGSGKTQLVGVGFLAFMIGRYPNRSNGLISYADQVAWSRSQAVKQLIENSRPYQLVFPEIKRSDRWGDRQFIVQRPNMGDPHPTLRAGGSGSAVVAYRFHGLLYDDPHDQKNSASPDQRRKVYENWEATISTRLTSNAWVVLIGTRWTEGDLISLVSAQEGWRVVHTKAIHPNGRSYWEQEYPIEKLILKRHESPGLFAIQYMGDTAGGEAAIIKHLSTYDEDPKTILFREKLLVASAWDTAFKKKESNDYSVGYIGGLGRDGRVYILDRIKGRWGMPELLTEIESSYQRQFQSYVWVEDAASGTSVIQTLMSESTVPVVPMAYKGDKVSRAHSLAPYLHGGHVLFPRGAEWFQDAEWQLTHFPNATHDDDLDALFILVDNLVALRHPSTINERPIIKLRMR